MSDVLYDHCSDASNHESTKCNALYNYCCASDWSAAKSLSSSLSPSDLNQNLRYQYHGGPALHCSVENNAPLETMEHFFNTILEKGLNLRVILGIEEDMFGCTLLHVAASKDCTTQSSNHRDVLSLIIQHCSAQDFLSFSGYDETPLDSAEREHLYENVRMLKRGRRSSRERDEREALLLEYT
jgi:hypothetical protein